MISSKTLAAALFVLVVALSFGTAHAGFSYTTLDVPGAVSTSAKDISGSNIVGGYSTGSNSYGYLYNGSTYTPLNFSAME